MEISLCTAKNEISFVLQADLGAKIRLLICECFFMPELDFIMLVGLLDENSGEELLIKIPQIVQRCLPESSLNSINSRTDFLLPSIDMQKTETASNPHTFNLCASLFIRDFPLS